MREPNQGAVSLSYEAFLDVMARFNKHGHPISPTTALVDIGIDSLDTVSVLVEIENKLGVAIPDEALTPAVFQTVASLWESVQQAGGAS